MKQVLQRKKEHEKEIKDTGMSCLTHSLTHSLTYSFLELSLETQPRDSKFSSQLVLLMQKEETMLRNDSLSPASTTGASHSPPHSLT